MNLNIKVKEKTTGTISIGGGYSSDDGLFAGGEITQRNLFGRGQTLALKAQISTETARYSLSFLEPSVYDTLYSAGFDIYKWNREYPDFTKDSEGFVVRVGHPFGDYSNLFAAYNFENANVTDLSRQRLPLFVIPGRTATQKQCDRLCCEGHDGQPIDAHQGFHKYRRR